MLVSLKNSEDTVLSNQIKELTMFTPIPTEFGRSDDDCAYVIWRRDHKSLILNLTCYGTISSIVCGLYDPSRGMIEVKSFELGWKWYCNDDDKLPSNN